MFGLGWPEIIVVVVTLLLVLGPSKLPQLGKSLGNAIKNFKGAVSGKEEQEKQIKS